MLRLRFPSPLDTRHGRPHHAPAEAAVEAVDRRHQLRRAHRIARREQLYGRGGGVGQIVEHHAGLPVAQARPEDRAAAAQRVADQGEAVLRRLQPEGRGVAVELARHEAVGLG